MDPILKKEIYERCADLPARAGDLRLRPYEWHFLMALDGRKTAGEAAAEVRLDESRLPEVIQRLRESRLMEIPELTWEEFAARYPDASAPARPGPAPAVEAPAPVAVVVVASETPARPPAPANPAPAAVTFAITRKTTAGAAPAATAPPADAPGPRGAERPLNLKQLIDYVTQHAGGGLRGKLAVYRLFLRVPNEQIRAAGIESLNFVDDRFEIREPAMREAILDAVAAVTGRPYPLPA